MWAIETKSVAKVEIDEDSLRIRSYRQDKMVDRVYREATAVLMGMGDLSWFIALGSPSSSSRLHRTCLPSALAGRSGRLVHRLPRHGY